jgi:tRNA (adenine57-N1/adenine58-N1)-methyltransferase
MDACIITLNLDVFPGCVVVESGTGSGCMTLSLARAVAPTGHVHTFEYNPTRATAARDEFSKHGVGHLVTVTCRDVCGKYADNEGGFSGVPDLGADAVFLDLPEPWLAVDHVLRVLKPGRTLCTYSPCIEQVMKTCEKLRAEGFHSVRMLEVRQRPYDGRRLAMDTVYLGRGGAVAPVPPALDVPSSSSSSSSSSSNAAGEQGGDNDEEEEESKKRQRRDDPPAATADAPVTVVNPYRITYAPPVMPTEEVLVARAMPEMKGHTAFLTFAVRPPLPRGADSGSSSSSGGGGGGDGVDKNEA